MHQKHPRLAVGILAHDATVLLAAKGRDDKAMELAKRLADLINCWSQTQPLLLIWGTLFVDLKLQLAT